jgi:CheY-like chemotaxis protein
MADPGQLQQVIMNLVVNARDAMSSGGRITIGTANADVREPLQWRDEVVPAGEYVALSVRDTGSGIPPEVQAQLFEPFFTTKGQGKGTGLGLSTVYGIVKQSGGYITLASEPTRGSTFTVHLPRIASGIQAAAKRRSEYSRGDGSETILLVEDEEIVRKMSREILQKTGYTVLEAPDGRAGLDLFMKEHSRIDLVVTDVVMPVMGGRELAERIDAVSPATKVLFMSGYTDDVVLRHGVQSGQMPMLAKPFSPAALTLKIREVLGETRRKTVLTK